ncbi:MAG: sigma-54 dependent transcriptional regulator [Thermodesulfobacteriota bacterium]|nr:sigma-54 dependent transcriptional regulator [Thermodesulfobacteriota bacterium]
MSHILIIDDDQAICKMLSALISEIGHDTVCSHTLHDGLKEALSNPYDVVLLDVQMPDGSGLDILPKIRETPSSPEVIIMTGFGNVDGAEIAIKNGAWDYIQKTDSPRKILLPLQRVIQYRDGLKKAQKSAIALRLDGIVGDSPSMKACFDLLAQAATSEANILLTGETGTGKEVFADAIHKNCPRASNNFVVVDCTTLPETLAENMLFGHERGAFTGADNVREGLIKQADRGTLFLDEVGELPLSVQKGFLRVLQERRFLPLGSKREIESNFRIISATNRDLDDMVKHGQFRNDLLFRLRSLTIALPPLREHPEDIKPLAIHHIHKLCEHYGMETKGFSSGFFEALKTYSWPGNIRELFNALERAFAASHHEPTLFPRHLPTNIRVKVTQSSITNKAPAKGSLMESPDFARTLPGLRDFHKTMEKKYLKDLIKLTKGNIKEACRTSGMSRSSLYDHLKRHKISIPNPDNP